MTKKDYVLLTSILYMAIQHLTAKQRQTLLDHACNLLKKDNPSFSAAIFIGECMMPRTFVNRTLRDG